MRWVVGLALVFALSGSACAAEKNEQIISLNETPAEKQDREFATQLAKELVAVELAKVTCAGVAQQGGAVLCQSQSRSI